MSHTDLFRIDSHKLIFHPHRVAQWLAGSNIYPVYMEISPVGCCNHRCTFCALDFAGYKPRFLDKELIGLRLTELGSLGVKSVLYGGEGEPLLHPDIAGIIQETCAAGIDTALSTNGTLLTSALAEQILPSLKWIKVSVNAGTPATYSAIHRTLPEDFQQVLSNIASAAQFIKSSGLTCTLGVQAVLLPENASEMEQLAMLVKEAGGEYLVIKPYSQHHKSLTRTYEKIDYSPLLHLSEKLDSFNDEDFRVIFRSNPINKMQNVERGYERCLALPFWSYIDAGGNVWGCSAFLEDERFLYGNIYEEDFKRIWEGEKRSKSLEFVACELNSDCCRTNCRMDEINLYLWELTHPGGHVNFI
ncbi:MAG: radical SAM protein [Geobacteraceae bacterium]|nr:radical SAM protein [Geobacteraceae bacterium]